VRSLRERRGARTLRPLRLHRTVRRWSLRRRLLLLLLLLWQRWLLPHRLRRGCVLRLLLRERRRGASLTCLLRPLRRRCAALYLRGWSPHGGGTALLLRCKLLLLLLAESKFPDVTRANHP
jgi:hypothetical protein